MAQKQKNGSPTTRSLFYPGSTTLKPQLAIALKRIFHYCDFDKDDALSNDELQKYQAQCFRNQLTTSELANLKRTIQARLYEGFNVRGMTLLGFYLMHAIIIAKGDHGSIWTILGHFGYTNDIMLHTNQLSVDEIPSKDVKLFSYALKALHYPPAPLYDYEAQTLKPLCARALKRIFILLDRDKDGALSVAELEALQKNTSDIHFCERLLREMLPEGINDRGITLTGFRYLFVLNMQKGFTECAWNLLREFGYGDDIKLRDGYISVSFKRAPDQTVELTNETVDFLKRIFCSFDLDNDGTLQPSELDDLFSTAPESPWVKAPYKNATEKAASGGLSLNGFLSEWSLMALLEPTKCLANLLYIGYPGDLTSALRITRRRQLDRMAQQSERNVIQCFVFGPRKAGKSALLNSFLRRQFTERYDPTNYERIATNVVVCPNGALKTLILREIPEERAKALISNKVSWAACDVALFVHDSSDEHMWQRAEEMLFKVARCGERSAGFEVPCLIVAAKNDMMCPYATAALQDSVGIHSSLGIEKPTCISTKLGGVNHIFHRIINAAEHPHLNNPETVAGKRDKFYNQFVIYSLVILSVGVAARLGIAFASRKNTSA